VPTLARRLIHLAPMKRTAGLAVLLAFAVAFATGCAAKQTTTPGRGPVIQHTDDSAEHDHGDLTRPVFGQR